MSTSSEQPEISTRAGAPEVVLGLYASTQSSAAAALLIGGRLVGFAEDERLSGVRGWEASRNGRSTGC